MSSRYCVADDEICYIALCSKQGFHAEVLSEWLAQLTIRPTRIFGDNKTDKNVLRPPCSAIERSKVKVTHS